MKGRIHNGKLKRGSAKREKAFNVENMIENTKPSLYFNHQQKPEILHSVAELNTSEDSTNSTHFLRYKNMVDFTSRRF